MCVMPKLYEENGDRNLKDLYSFYVYERAATSCIKKSVFRNVIRQGRKQPEYSVQVFLINRILQNQKLLILDK